MCDVLASRRFACLKNNLLEAKTQGFLLMVMYRSNINLCIDGREVDFIGLFNNTIKSSKSNILLETFCYTKAYDKACKIIVG